MKILLTGGNGFLGKAIHDYFSKNQNDQVKILGIGMECDYNINLATDSIIFQEYFDLVIHAAGKAHSVPKNGKEQRAFFDVNFEGTVNLLAALSYNPPKSFIFISTVAVYGIESGTNINEFAELNANDPYGKSKIAAEKLIKDWCKENSTSCVIFRLPLLIGGNPPGNLATMIKGIRKGYYFNVNNGTARKSMVMVSDIAPAIHSAIGKSGIFHLTDGVHPSFNELSKVIALELGKKKVYNISRWIALIAAKTGDIFGKNFPINTSKLNKITADLTFDDSKARRELNWMPSSVLQNFKL